MSSSDSEGDVSLLKDVSENFTNENANGVGHPGHSVWDFPGRMADLSLA
jgi:hypothetical protein